ncbi:MAG: hypothetical protein JM58_06425 [Peptococcaceae bacterium BICA1-8]|nr:MAG: hypothetical protein JM58_06425 [Peptococcaceae bacterium BICA1-8]
MEKEFEDLSKYSSLKDRVYNIIKEKIINGSLEPGSHLNELMLSKAMNISRAPIRETINVLEKEGFLELIPRKGAMVTTITRQDAKNIWEMRKVLEVYAAKYATNLVTDEELGILDQKLKFAQQGSGEFLSHMDFDLALHGMLYKHITNKIFKDFMAIITQHYFRIRYYAEEHSAMQKQNIVEATKEHEAILCALKNRNEEEVAQVMYVHLTKAEKRTMDALNEQET